MHQRLCFPVNHFAPTVQQRTEFYANEFDQEGAKAWLSRLPAPLRNPIFSIDVGTESGLVHKRFRTKKGKMLLISLRNIEELKQKLVWFSPEDVYYDRNLYEDKEKCIDCRRSKKKDCSKCANITGQHVMFDIDPENIGCPNCGTLKERIDRMSMYGFCYICFKKAAAYTVKLYRTLADIGYKKLQVIYSGRGFHVYIDDHDAYSMALEERDALARSINDEKRIPIDIWVTTGRIKYARLPYSLHGLVGKLVTPIAIDDVLRLYPSRSERLTPSSLRA